MRNVQTNDVRATVSNQAGHFSVIALPLGEYALKITMSGFAGVERRGIPLRSGEVYNAGTIPPGGRRPHRRDR